MPIAHLSRAANFGNVTITRSIPAKGYGAGGIWGGYGPAVIEDCINFGTVKAPDDAAGINPAMHSNGNGGTTIRRCYNAGLVQVDDTACRYSNVALISHYVDTRNPIDPALMHVDSAYFASDVCPAIAGDTLATPLTRAELMTAPLGEGFLYREYCLPTLHSLDSLAVANVHTACLAFPFGIAHLRNVVGQSPSASASAPPRTWYGPPPTTSPSTARARCAPWVPARAGCAWPPTTPRHRSTSSMRSTSPPSAESTPSTPPARCSPWSTTRSTACA